MAFLNLHPKSNAGFNFDNELILYFITHYKSYQFAMKFTAFAQSKKLV